MIVHQARNDAMAIHPRRIPSLSDFGLGSEDEWEEIKEEDEQEEDEEDDEEEEYEEEEEEEKKEEKEEEEEKEEKKEKNGVVEWLEKLKASQLAEMLKAAGVKPTGLRKSEMVQELTERFSSSVPLPCLSSLSISFLLISCSHLNLVLVVSFPPQFFAPPLHTYPKGPSPGKSRRSDKPKMREAEEKKEKKEETKEKKKGEKEMKKEEKKEKKKEEKKEKKKGEKKEMKKEEKKEMKKEEKKEMKNEEKKEKKKEEKKEKKKGDEGGEETRQCIICWSAPKSVLFLQCSHYVCCSKCSNPLKACPVCRTTITQKVRVFEC